MGAGRLHPLRMFLSCLSPPLTVSCLMGFDCLFLSGAPEIVQLLREGESEPATAGQAGDEHLERHAGDSQPGKECGLQKLRSEQGWGRTSHLCPQMRWVCDLCRPLLCLTHGHRGSSYSSCPSSPCCCHDTRERACFSPELRSRRTLALQRS